jgi:hypothetical protein
MTQKYYQKVASSEVFRSDVTLPIYNSSMVGQSSRVRLCSFARCSKQMKHKCTDISPGAQAAPHEVGTWWSTDLKEMLLVSLISCHIYMNKIKEISFKILFWKKSSKLRLPSNSIKPQYWKVLKEIDLINLGAFEDIERNSWKSKKIKSVHLDVIKLKRSWKHPEHLNLRK